MPDDVRSTLFQVMERTAAGRERPNKEKQMNKFTKVAVLALIASGLAMPAFAQSNAGGSMSSSSSGSMSGSMSSGSMSGSMSDHAKPKPKKKTNAMTSGSMSGSMSNGSMSGNSGH